MRFEERDGVSTLFLDAEGGESLTMGALRKLTADLPDEADIDLSSLELFEQYCSIQYVEIPPMEEMGEPPGLNIVFRLVAPLRRLVR